MKYDDAEFYFLDFTTDLPNENGGRHIALFLEWAILRGLAAPEMLEQADALRSGAVDPVEMLFDLCDGKLLSDDLNDEGNAFAGEYYPAHHMSDFVAAMNVREDADVNAIFGAELTQQRHDRVLWQLDQHYSRWLRGRGLPSKQTLFERVLRLLAPVLEAGGFPRSAEQGYGSHSVHALFQRGAQWEHPFQRVELSVEDSAIFYGVHLALDVHMPGLDDAIYAEKSADMGSVSSLQWAATVPFDVLAQGWQGPLQNYTSGGRGFWVFREADIEPLAEWLAARLEGLLLPTLRGIDSERALTLAYDTRPLSASPIYDRVDSYGALLAAQRVGHPRLRAMLDETEQTLNAREGRGPHENGSLALIGRIRSRLG